MFTRKYQKPREIYCTELDVFEATTSISLQSIFVATSLALIATLTKSDYYDNPDANPDTLNSFLQTLEKEEKKKKSSSATLKFLKEVA
ncbi:hypothetical protein Trydic_g1404 [Trypoxylus dichotomus]